MLKLKRYLSFSPSHTWRRILRLSCVYKLCFERTSSVKHQYDTDTILNCIYKQNKEIHQSLRLIFKWKTKKVITRTKIKFCRHCVLEPLPPPQTRHYFDTFSCRKWIINKKKIFQIHLWTAASHNFFCF